MRQLGISLFGALLLLAFSPAANAEEATDVISEYGLSVGVGGGVADFVGEDMRDMTGTAGAWEARIVVGTNKSIGIEAGYIGSVQSIDTLGLDSDALLLSSGADAAIRLHLLNGDFRPYIFGGAGWRRYDLTRVDTNTSSVTESDDVIEVPLGVGVMYGFDHFL